VSWLISSGSVWRIALNLSCDVPGRGMKISISSFGVLLREILELTNLDSNFGIILQLFYKKAMLVQSEPCNAAFNFDTSHGMARFSLR